VQAEADTTRRFGGTGLGLTITRSLTELMGGGLCAESRPGEGSVFTATIEARVPEGTAWGTDLANLARAHDPGTPPPSASPLRSGQIQGRVLLAEDSEDNRRLFVLLLQRLGLEVTEAADGAEAVDKIRGSLERGAPFDLVLMDLDMPVLSGADAMREIKRLDPSVPVVALTAHTISGTREKLLGEGFDGYSAKPVKRADFAELCRAWIGARDRLAA